MYLTDVHDSKINSYIGSNLNLSLPHSPPPPYRIILPRTNYLSLSKSQNMTLCYQVPIGPHFNPTMSYLGLLWTSSPDEQAFLFNLIALVYI